MTPENQMNIWIWAALKDGVPDTDLAGLIGQARRISTPKDTPKQITVLALGPANGQELKNLCALGVHRIIHVEDPKLADFHGELFAGIFLEQAAQNPVSCILMLQSPESLDLAPRLAALMQAPLVTRAVDFRQNEDHAFHATRPTANGYLFEDLAMAAVPAPIICFSPSILGHVEPDGSDSPITVEIEKKPLSHDPGQIKTRISGRTKADAGTLDLSDADVVVAGGRGMCDKGQFELLHELADLLGGPVGGTRPAVDMDFLPYERQIGQTGKTIAPDLLINCGISGANEYTAGIEKSKSVIAVNTDERARIFDFADLGVVGDAQKILPLVIELIKKKSS